MRLETKLEISNVEYLLHPKDSPIAPPPFFIIEVTTIPNGLKSNLSIPVSVLKKYGIDTSRLDGNRYNNLYLSLESRELETYSPCVTEIHKMKQLSHPNRLSKTLSDAIRSGTKVSIIGGGQIKTFGRGDEKPYDTRQLRGNDLEICYVEEVKRTNWRLSSSPLFKDEESYYVACLMDLNCMNPESQEETEILSRPPFKIEISEKEYKLIRELPPNAIMSIKKLKAK
jgi:hypothetical protein